jgi:ATP-binding protein involved in chromosome partitioning
MDKNISEKSIRNMLKEVKHPAIDRSLLDLGVIKEIAVKEGKVVITMALPFPNIPIIDQLVSSIKEPIEKLGVEVEVKQTVMNQEELQAFLKMEGEGWTG